MKFTNFKNLFFVEERIDYYNCITAFLAVFSTTIAFLFFFKDAFFNGVGWIDPFIYVGYGYNYLDPSYLTGYYKISRLPWVLTQFVFRSIFNENLVGYFLHFSVYSASSYLIFNIAKKFSDDIPALISAITLPIFLIIYSGNPDYHNNFSAVSFLALIFYVANGTLAKKDDFNFFIITGVLYALVVHSNILLSADAAIYAAAFYIAIKTSQNQPIFKNLNNKITPIIIGFVICTLALCLTNALFGRHFWFMKPLWKFMLGSNPGNNDHYWQPFSNFIGNSKHLAHFFALFIYSSFLVSYLFITKSHKKNPLIFFVNLAFIPVVIELILTQTTGINNLQIGYFAFTAIIPFFLTLTINLSFFLQQKNSDISSKKICAIALFLVTILTIFLFKNDLFYTKIDQQYPFVSYCLIWLSFFALLPLLKSKSHKLTILLSTTTLFLFITSSTAKDTNYKFSNCNTAQSMTQSWLDVNSRFKQYKLDFQNNANGNIFLWWNRDQKVKDSCSKEVTHTLTDISRSIVVASAGSAYPLDDAWLDGGMNKIENLWQNNANDSIKKTFLDYKNAPRVLILMTTDEEDAKKMIKKMKEYNADFSLSEKRKIISDAFTLTYFILTENRKFDTQNAE